MFIEMLQLEKSSHRLRWCLQAAQDACQRVIVCCHLPLHPSTCPGACLLWNYDEVLTILQQSGVVVATIAGHTHQNGYYLDAAGIHHVVLPAVLETPPARDCYGWVDVYDHALHLHGVDTMMSLELQVQDSKKHACK